MFRETQHTFKNKKKQ